MVDLHCHTSASDGTLSPHELVERAKADGADVISVTDHDTVDGIADASSHGKDVGVRVVPGIELSCYLDGAERLPRIGRSVHMLGYFIDPTYRSLLEELAMLKEERVTRALRMVERLNELGYELTFDEVRNQSQGDVLARPHVARALVARGYIAEVRDAFTPELIGDGGRADVVKRSPTPKNGIALIRSAGGVAVIAHAAVGHHEGPGRLVPIALIEELAADGLTGIEVDHPDHPEYIRRELGELAERLGLVATGGSDFHGDMEHRVAKCVTAPESLLRLESLAGRAGPTRAS